MWEDWAAGISFVYLDPKMIGKVVVSLIIFLIAVVAAFIVNRVLMRWQKKLVSLIEKRSVGELTSTMTKLTIIRRLFSATIYFLAFVFFLFQFETMRNLGAGLLASAGVAGIVLGMAARNTLSNVIAGITISFSQPVRLNDAVIFENDFGWIEEISLMHTIIKTWDNRRIVVPNDILANKVIQNWTIRDSSLLGVVMIYVDYYCDVEKVRQWIVEIVKASKFWNKQGEPGVQVVDFTDKSMVLRALASADDAPSAWNLRCELREKLIKKFKEEGIPLPKIRIEGNNPTAVKV
ncbi:MAG: mechanosensitive ion channel family protein [Candidatus Margulisbacteria bacterium]|nr:mechanosensitive ion channel family protein [Candidatus Margulisiibacteriota bacterium]